MHQASAEGAENEGTSLGSCGLHTSRSGSCFNADHSRNSGDESASTSASPALSSRGDASTVHWPYSSGAQSPMSAYFDPVSPSLPCLGPSSRAKSPMSAYFDPPLSTEHPAAVIGMYGCGQIAAPAPQFRPEVRTTTVQAEVPAWLSHTESAWQNVLTTTMSRLFAGRGFMGNGFQRADDEEHVPLLPGSHQSGAMDTLPYRKLDWKLPRRYRLGGILGMGSYGCVCEAWDIQARRRVAVKRIEGAFRNGVLTHACKPSLHVVFALRNAVAVPGQKSGQCVGLCILHLFFMW